MSHRKYWLIRFGLLLLLVWGGVWMLGMQPPSHLGVHDGQLAPCPDRPNCVSTQAEDGEHRVEPLALDAIADASEAIRQAVRSLPRTTIVTETDDYVHAECRSLIWRFVDDLELWIDRDNGLLHARSASRLGYSDLGVNRQRVEQLFSELRAAELEE